MGLDPLKPMQYLSPIVGIGSDLVRKNPPNQN